MNDVLIVLGSVLAAAGVIPYWISALQGRARPNVVSWLTWTLLTLIVSSAAFASNDWRVGTVVLANALGTASVVMLGFWKGYAQMTKFDACCQIMAMLGLLSWPILHTIVPAVAVTIAVDAIALLPTLRHSWRKPYEEAWMAYGLQSLGSLCLLVATGFHGSAAIGYPAYLALADGSVVVVVLAQRYLFKRGGAQ